MTSCKISPKELTWSRHEARYASALSWSACSSIRNALRLQDMSCSPSKKLAISSGASGMRNSKFLLKKYKNFIEVICYSSSFIYQQSNRARAAYVLVHKNMNLRNLNYNLKQLSSLSVTEEKVVYGWRIEQQACTWPTDANAKSNSYIGIVLRIQGVL